MPTLLVVDDSAVDRRLVGGLLEKEGRFSLLYAKNGVEALDLVRNSRPDLVVTDLQMPQMDGLELVRAVRFQFPGVPVILMTAHGSEALAIEALEQGAASYVPKSQLADKLAETVDQVLSLAHSDKTYEQLIECLTRTEFSFFLGNDAGLIDPLVDLVQQTVVGMRLFDATGRFRIGMALKEALLNALYHGNLEINSEQVEQAREDLLMGKGYNLLDQRRAQSPYKDRKIFVDVRISCDEAVFVIRDQGPGFDTSKLPQRTNNDAAALENNRGLWLIRTFMDDIAYNPTGNEITMTKRRDLSANGQPA